MSVRKYLSEIKELVSLDERQLNNIFDKLNLLSAADVTQESDVVGDLLLSLANLIPGNNDHLLSKFCCLLCYLLEKSSIQLCPTSSEFLIEFMTSKISLCASWVLSDVLVSFSTLLRSATSLTSEQANILLQEDDTLLACLSPQELNKSIIYNALRCLCALLQNLSEITVPSENLSLCYKKCLLLLKESDSLNGENEVNAKILIYSLKCLQVILSHKNAEITNVGEILGILKSLSYAGLPGQAAFYRFDLIPTLSFPDMESQSESDASHKKFHKKKSRRRVKRNQHKSMKGVQSNEEVTEEYNQCCVSDSLSKSLKDIQIKGCSSDSEVDSQTSRALLVSVRQNAYQTLLIVSKLTDRKTMFSYWTSFLPDHPAVSGLPTNRTLFTTILKDSSSQVRFHALTVLSEMLRGSKQFLAIAEERNARHSAFISLSSILASMINEVHRCLLLTLLTEKSALLLCQILKCYAILAENVPYNKLNKEILFKYLKYIKRFIYHKDIQVQIACLTVFTCILNSNQTPDEIEDVILSCDLDSVDSFKLDEVLSGDGPWIVEACIQKVFYEEQITLRVQSLQLLGSLIGRYFVKSKSFLPSIKKVVLFCFQDSDSAIQYHGIRLMDVMGRCRNNISGVEESIQVSISELHLHLLTDSFIKCLTNDKQKPLQAAACDCLSTLTSNDFALLDHKKQILYVSILMGLASDSNASVRGTAIRCLGLLCSFPSMIEDSSFYDDLARILILAVKDVNVNVRFKASWALGNLSDVFISNKSAFLSDSEASIRLFYSVGMACVEYSTDCERVKANAVRALGNFLFYLPQSYLSSCQILDFVKTAYETLLSVLSTSFMKVCWNACYAFGSMMRNHALLEMNVIKMDVVLNALIPLLKSQNFKVRISSAQALCSLKERSHFGGSFTLLWKQILFSLLSSSQDINFKEIKHQQNLCLQLCHSICYLTSMLTLQDLCEIQEETILAKETLLASMWKFGIDLKEEQRTTLYSALERINFLDKESHLLLVTLRDVLEQAVLANNSLKCPSRDIQ